MKPIRRIRVVYRSYLLFLFKRWLPKEFVLRVRRRGVLQTVKIPVGTEYYVGNCREMRPVRFRDVFCFKVVRYRTKKGVRNADSKNQS